MILEEAQVLHLPAGVHTFDSPIILSTRSAIVGDGLEHTIIKFVGDFNGPAISSAGFHHLAHTDKWFYEDGVPVRMSIKDLSIDLSSWKPKAQATTGIIENPMAPLYDLGTFGIGLYAKRYAISNVHLHDTPYGGFYSSCSLLGGKRHPYLDAPEAFIDNFEITTCGGDGFVFSGPHDTIIGRLLVSLTKGKGVYIFTTPQHNGACDIDFIHAYGTNDVAIDIQAKIKARFLQGDTGIATGVRIGGSNKTFIETIEAFKTRAGKTSEPSYAVEIVAVENQIGMIRCRADAGTHGVHIKSPGNIISSINCDCKYPHPNFKNLDQTFLPIGLHVSAGQNIINAFRCINYRTAPIHTTRLPKRCFLAASLDSAQYSDALVSGTGFDESSKIVFI